MPNNPPGTRTRLISSRAVALANQWKLWEAITTSTLASGSPKQQPKHLKVSLIYNLKLNNKVVPNYMYNFKRYDEGVGWGIGVRERREKTCEARRVARKKRRGGWAVGRFFHNFENYKNETYKMPVLTKKSNSV